MFLLKIFVSIFLLKITDFVYRLLNASIPCGLCIIHEFCEPLLIVWLMKVGAKVEICYSPTALVLLTIESFFVPYIIVYNSDI